MKTHPSFELFGRFVWTPNHSTFDHFGADVVSLIEISAFRSAGVRSDVTLCPQAFNVASLMADVIIVLVRSFLLLQSR